MDDGMRSGFKFILLHVHIWLSQHLVYVCLNICPFILKDLIKYADEKERRARSGRVACAQLLPAGNFAVLPSQHVLASTILEAPPALFIEKDYSFPTDSVWQLFFFLNCVCVCVCISWPLMYSVISELWVPFCCSVCLPFCQYCVVLITVTL